MADPLDQFLSEDAPKAPTNAQPFTASQRLIVQNFFDSNDAARAKYLKQLGYEMDKRDDNLIRPIGSKGAFVEIDPGFGDAYKRGGLKGLGKEVMQDAGDVAYDLTSVGEKVLAAIGAGGSAGATGGAVGSLGGPVGGAIGALSSGIPAAMIAAAATGALSNGAKQKIRDLFLDENMPFDAKEMAADAALSAIGAGIFGGVAKGFRKVKDLDLTTRIDGIKNALKAAGNVADPNLIERAAQNPEQFTKDAVEGGSSRLNQAVKNIFGLADDESVKTAKDLKRARPDSYFGKILQPLTEAQDTAYNTLATDRRANVPYADAMGQMKNLYSALETKMLSGNPTQAEEEAFKVVQDQVKTLRKMGAANLGIDPSKITDKQLDQVQFNYGQARDFLEGLQDRAFNTTTKTSNPVLKQVAGGMRSYLDNVAEKSGVTDAAGNDVGKLMPQINAKISSAIDDFNEARDLIKPGTLMQAYVGGAKSADQSAAAQHLKQFMSGMDERYGTQLAKDFDPLTAQTVFENIYNGAPAKGSSRINAFAMQEAAKGFGQGAVAGGTLGSLTGVGTVPGAVVGGLIQGSRKMAEAGALAQPEKGLQALGGMLEKQAIRNAQDPTQLAIKDALTAGVGAGAAGFNASVEGNAPPEVDPLDAFLK